MKHLGLTALKKYNQIQKEISDLLDQVKNNNSDHLYDDWKNIFEPKLDILLTKRDKYI